jgi:hypothetical protein
MESSMRKGLFATAFGPSFYRGYVGRQEELVAVALPSDAADLDDGLPRWDTRRRAATVLLAGTAAAAIATSVFGVLTWNAKSRYDDTSLERKSEEAKADYERYRLWTVATGIAGAALAATGGAVFYWPWRHEASRAGIDRVAFTGNGVVAGGSF